MQGMRPQHPGNDLSLFWRPQPAGREETYKVRDVKYSAKLGRLATLTTNGGVQLWDPHLNSIRSVRQHVIALGGLAHARRKVSSVLGGCQAAR